MFKLSCCLWFLAHDQQGSCITEAHLALTQKAYSQEYISLYQKEVTLDFYKKLFQAKKGVAFSGQLDSEIVHPLPWRQLKMELRPNSTSMQREERQS